MPKVFHQDNELAMCGVWILSRCEMMLKPFDDTVDNEDEYETPPRLYNELVKKYHIFPKIDAAATAQNRKCLQYFSKTDSALFHEWIKDTWCNPPHSLTGLFVSKAYNEWQKHNINIMMLIPTNTMSAAFWHGCVEGHAEYHPIFGRIRFLQNGRPSSHKSRNAYVVVIWRRK